MVTIPQVYDWDDSTQGVILSSFFWGYIISQVPASQLAQRYGAKSLVLVAGASCAFLTVITPWAAGISWKLLVAIRMIQGFFQGFYFPCVHTILSKWAHPSERGTLASVTYSGAQIGTVIMLASSGIIASSFMGWPGIFYCSGGICLAWTIAFYIFGANSPATCTSISYEEKAFIESMPGSNKGTLPVPWKEIFKSKAVISLIIVHCTHNWGYWTLLTEIPSYLKQVFGFDIKTVRNRPLIQLLLPQISEALSTFLFPFSECPTLRTSLPSAMDFNNDTKPRVRLSHKQKIHIGQCGSEAVQFNRSLGANGIIDCPVLYNEHNISCPAVNHRRRTECWSWCGLSGQSYRLVAKLCWNAHGHHKQHRKHFVAFGTVGCGGYS